MGQSDIVQIVKEGNKKMTLEEIRGAYIKKYNNIGAATIAMGLSKLRKFNILNYDLVKGKHPGNPIYRYWIK